ncbi:hypothetical protein C8R43DRAFT_905290 [Mycena crocata]|nr:hypothetical protein C8R43DRAFT_905290 [Mycena crocata]
MRVARGLVNGVRPNALDLGPWHAKVIAFCDAVANDVDLLLAPDASYETGSLDGHPWEHPNVFYVIQKMAGGLPHLRGCLKAFMTGAAATWRRFGEEFEPDGVIAKISAELRRAIYVNPTNDHNEGALGRLRSAIIHAARLSLAMHNAKSKYSINGTREFLRSNAVTAAFRAWLRGEARRRIDSGRDRTRRAELVAYEKVVVGNKQAAEKLRKEKDAARKAEIANLTPLLDVPWIQANHKSVVATEIVKQINWHRQFVEKDIIPSKTLIGAMAKSDKVTQLIVAVTRFNRDIFPKLQLMADAALSAGAFDIDMPSVDAGIPIVDNWDAHEDLEEEDMMDEC